MKEEEKQLINKTRETKTSQRTSKMHNILDNIHLNKERGITLIALVITIVILIILATVTLNVVLGEGGLIDRAQQAKDMTEQAALEEQQKLNSLMDEMANIMAEEPDTPKPPETIDEAKPNPGKDGPKFDNTKTITDDLDNPVTIPGGFHLDKDSGTKVEEGIVIEDENGNQFVWIPVGTYNVTTEVDKDGTQDGKLTNELTRRTFTSTGSTPENGDDLIDPYYYGEGNDNSVAKDQIEGFKTSATTNKGFYIGRYEAGTATERLAETDPLTTPLVQANKYPYVYVTRDQAKQQAETMYSGNEFVTSELISSYAWDTALNFICQTNEEGYLLATTKGKAYGNIGTDIRTQTGSYIVEGEISDKYSNIHDVLGNCVEWTTEYSGNSSFGPCVFRGGCIIYDTNYAASRGGILTSRNGDAYSFRLQLYVNLES